MDKTRLVPAADDPVERLILYLISIADNTAGSEVWRALFSEMLANHRGTRKEKEH